VARTTNPRISITLVDPTRSSQRLAIHRNTEVPRFGVGTWVLGLSFSRRVRITIRYNYPIDLIQPSRILIVFLHLGGEEAGSPLSTQLARQLPSRHYLFTSLFHYFVPDLTPLFATLVIRSFSKSFILIFLQIAGVYGVPSNLFSQDLLQLIDLRYPPFLSCYNSTAPTVLNRCKTSVTLQLALRPLSERSAGKENIAHA
jgi:hypothetical protein